MSLLTEEPSVSHQIGMAVDGKNNQYLTFHLGEEEYGVDILRVQEIRGWVWWTPFSGHEKRSFLDRGRH